jgi:hypothetical protein
MKLQKWLNEERLNTVEAEIKVLDTYKGYVAGDAIYYTDVDTKEDITGVFIKALQRPDMSVDVVFTNKKGKEDQVLGYFLITKQEHEANLKKAKLKAAEKEENKKKRVEKMKATMAAKKAKIAETSKLDILSGDVEIPNRVTMVFLNKIVNPYTLEKTDTKSYYVAYTDKEEIGIYFTKTLKEMATQIVELGVQEFLNTYTY